MIYLFYFQDGLQFKNTCTIIEFFINYLIYIKDIFNKDVDYIKVVTDYVNYKINQNKDWYYEDVFINIPNDQAFYLTDDGIVIYFGLDEIAPSEFGVPKFKMSFHKFSPYINPRFYCVPQNINPSTRRKPIYTRK